MDDFLIPKGKKVKRIKPKRFEDKAHMDFIRQLPCVACLSHAPNECHHILTGVVRGMGLKGPDSMTVPLCHNCHHQVHHGIGDEITVLGFNPYHLASVLYKVTGNHSAAVRLISKERCQNA